ncbi:mitochondrial carrier [Multifurca ochricompacta]|uniref:Mitochondrial carrier n=1 Tax=Multifurca ochricompacta TaxID=376703 RepID=A0AAD4M6B4_9AGAM|nr:mitochondrial carrier [Multifurca ochricompacta]
MAVQSKQAQPQQLTPVGYALAGALGGCFSNAVVYPLDTVKTRIQADSGHGRSVRALLKRILKEEGIAGFYRGFGATMLNTFSMQYAYFFFYSLVRTSYLKRLAARRPTSPPVKSLSTVAELALGAIAGALAQIFTIPVSVIATRQQLGAPKGKGKAGEEHDGSFFGVAREIVREEGITGLWLGLRPGLVLTVNPAITYGMFERIKGAVLLAREKVGDTSTSLGPGLSFILGATSKSLATVVTYPYIMAKVRIQTRTKDVEETENGTLPVHVNGNVRRPQNEGAIDILARVLRTEGFVGWYKGMGAQIIKAVLSQGVLFMSKEQFEKYALAIMVLYYRFSVSQ